MTVMHQVNPESFIEQTKQKPAHGRGAWTRIGIDFDWRFSLSEDPAVRIGTVCQKSLDHWAVAAGAYAIQTRLVALGHLDPLSAGERGIYGPRTKAAVVAFQQANRDPDGNAQLDDDGTVGRSDCRALWTPVLLAAERKYGVPSRYLLGETNHESAMDTGAVGGLIYYPDRDSKGEIKTTPDGQPVLEYRGVDRGMSQINSDANAQVSWLQAYDPVFSLDWSAARLRSYHDRYQKAYPQQSEQVLWMAAVCAHNNPSAAGQWAKTGVPPTEAAAHYVAGVQAAIY